MRHCTYAHKKTPEGLGGNSKRAFLHATNRCVGGSTFSSARSIAPREEGEKSEEVEFCSSLTGGTGATQTVAFGALSFPATFLVLPHTYREKFRAKNIIHYHLRMTCMNDLYNNILCLICSASQERRGGHPGGEAGGRPGDGGMHGGGLEPEDGAGVVQGGEANTKSRQGKKYLEVLRSKVKVRILSHQVLFLLLHPCSSNSEIPFRLY